MKIKTLLSSTLLFAALGTVLITTSSNSGGFGGNNQNCQGCHGTDANTVVAINGLPSSGGYTPGTTYPITVTVTNPSKLAAGFDIQTTEGMFVNPGPGVTINGSGLGAGHTGGATSMVGGTATFNLSWQAPMTGGATASFNAEGNAVNLNSSTSGDGANSASNVLVPLPVQFVTLQLFQNKEGINIQWETLQEENIKEFIIERSFDGTAFEAVGSQLAKGDSKYTFIDQNISGNMKYYYRIKEIDLDNNFTLSKVQTISTNNTKLNVQLFPTNVNHLINVNGLENYDGLTLSVFNVQGIEIANLEIENNQFFFNDISNGNYIIRLMRNNKLLKTQKITVSK